MSVTLAHAQNNLNPTQSEARIKLQAIELQEFDQSTHPSLSFEQLKRQLTIERSRFGEWLSIDEIHQIADAMTLHLRSLGYAFHSVYLPPQKVQGGLVVLVIQQGSLADVQVLNQSKWPDAIFSKPFKPLLQQVLYAPDIEQRVQALKLQTGFNVFAFFSRASGPGEARLNLRVTPAAKRSWGARIDNFGSASSGKQRLIASYTEHQLTGHHDRLSLALLRSLDDVENTYGSIQYVLPLPSLKYEFDVSASNNQFEVGDRFAILGLQGDTQAWSLGVTRYGNFQPQKRSSLRLSLSQKESSLSQLIGDDESEISRSFNLSWDKRLQSDTGRWMLQSSWDISKGDFGPDSSQLDSSFTKIGTNQFGLIGMSSGRSRNVMQLYFRGQYTADSLPSSEGMSLTGIYGVRAFAPGAFHADRGALLSLEWRLPNALNRSASRWRLEPYLLSDWGYGEDGEGKDLSRAVYGSAGIGLQLTIGKHWSIQSTFAKSIQARVNSDEVENDEQLLFEIRWH